MKFACFSIELLVPESLHKILIYYCLQLLCLCFATFCVRKFVFSVMNPKVVKIDIADGDANSLVFYAKSIYLLRH
jgi:hypothetical protein